MSDQPIRDGADGLRQVRDEAVPHEVDSVIDILTGDAENLRRLAKAESTRLTTITDVKQPLDLTVWSWLRSS